jgi:hypothetical protein
MIYLGISMQITDQYIQQAPTTWLLNLNHSPIIATFVLITTA